MSTSTTTFEVVGAKELMEGLRELSTIHRTDLAVKATAVKAIRAALEPVLEDVIARAPYDENRRSNTFVTRDGDIKVKPHLRDTAKIDARIPNENDINSYHLYDNEAFAIGIVSVKKSAVSLSQEFGNATTTAQPYLRISFETNIDKMLSIFKSQMQAIIPQYKKRLNRRGIR
jgi:glutamine cyclotransferase